MATLERIILSELETSGIDVSDLGVEIRRGKGLLNRRKVLEVFGVVRSEADHRAVVRVAQHHTGEEYELKDSVKVHARVQLEDAIAGCRGSGGRRAARDRRPVFRTDARPRP